MKVDQRDWEMERREVDVGRGRKLTKKEREKKNKTSHCVFLSKMSNLITVLNRGSENFPRYLINIEKSNCTAVED